MTGKRANWADPDLLDDVRKYGTFDVNGCLSCGGCTITCELVTKDSSFSPRRSVQYVRAGLRDKLRAGLDPWLCYYCGDCTETCPRQTETAESMMTLRRYLMSQYDWTGLAARFFKSKMTEIVALASVAVAMLAVILFHFYSDGLLEFGHLFTLIAVPAVVLLVFGPNVTRAYQFTMRGANPRPSLWLYFTQFKAAAVHAVAQLQLRKCKDKTYWLKHWFVAAGYVLTLGSAVTIGFPVKTYFHPFYHPLNLVGTIGSLALISANGWLIIDRARKQYAMHKFSELSDWLFVTWIFTFILLLLISYIALKLESPAAHGIYTAHLVMLAAWALVIVPFGKTAHLLYRPIMIYLQTVKEQAAQSGVRSADRLPAEAVTSVE